MKTPTVLLILENHDQLKRYGTYLGERGYEIVTCTSPGEGINCLASHPVSLVIVGQDTPEFEGRPVLEYSVRFYPGVPVLVIARVVDLHWYLVAMELGATDYLEELEPWDLVRVVETQLLRSGIGALLQASAGSLPTGTVLAPSARGGDGTLLERAAAARDAQITLTRR